MTETSATIKYSFMVIYSTPKQFDNAIEAFNNCCLSQDRRGWKAFGAVRRGFPTAEFFITTVVPITEENLIVIKESLTEAEMAVFGPYANPLTPNPSR